MADSNPSTRVREGIRAPAWSAAFLKAFLWCAARCPNVLRAIRPLGIWAAWAAVPALRAGTTSNARRILGPDVSRRSRSRLGRAVFANLVRAVTDLVEGLRLPDDALLARVERIDGMDHYRAARAARRGLILLTGHFGGYETGMIAVKPREDRVYVLYRRDPVPVLEAARSAWRRRLGVTEVPLDEGLQAWVRLRDELAADGVVTLLGDRTMPGQKGIPVPFLHGRIALPTGPFKLARLTGAPVLPVFVLRNPDGRLRVEVQPPLAVDAHDDPRQATGAVREFASRLEQVVREHPDQWLMLHRAWLEDAPPPPMEDAT
jgi:KDO2-lipid IV(A) lauroyltransferase